MLRRSMGMVMSDTRRIVHRHEIVLVPVPHSAAHGRKATVLLVVYLEH